MGFDRKSSFRFGRGLLMSLSLMGFVSTGCTQLGFSDRRPWEGPPPKLKVGPVVDQAHLTRSTLPNGLRVLILEDHRLHANPKLAGCTSMFNAS